MKNMFYAEGIESTGIQPYYIYLYRDGRDVALSFKRRIVGENIFMRWLRTGGRIRKQHFA